MEKKVVRWGVLGCSGIGKARTIPGMLACDNSELYAIAGRNAEKLKDSFPDISKRGCCTKKMNVVICSLLGRQVK